MNRKKSFLITGAAGFIGSALTKCLIDQGYAVYSVDAFSDYYSVNLKRMRVENFEIRTKTNFAEIDLLDKSNFENFVKEINPDFVIHLASQPGVRLPFHEYHRYTRNNILSFDNLVSACISAGVDNLIYASSSSVYGDNAQMPYSESESHLSPKSYYGFTKLINEGMIKYFFNDLGTKVRGLRFFSVYGPWGRPDMAYFRICANAVIGSEFIKFGDGNIERDFTYIDDVIHATNLLIENLCNAEKGFQDVVNIGGSRPISLNTIIKSVANLASKDVSFSAGEQNSLDVLRTQSNPNYLKSLIGYVPQTSVEIGLREVLNWMQKNEIASNLESWINSCN